MDQEEIKEYSERLLEVLKLAIEHHNKGFTVREFDIFVEGFIDGVIIGRGGAMVTIEEIREIVKPAVESDLAKAIGVTGTEHDFLSYKVVE